MKENVFDLLMYLFENYFYNEEEPQPDRDSLESELFDIGFSRTEIRKAFEWLDALAHSRELPAVSTSTQRCVRVFTASEQERLDTEMRGFMLYLEQVGILTAHSRELVIDRLMALGDEDIDLDTVKWVVLMVLFSQPGQEEAFASMENLVFDGPNQLVH
ncbi:Protein Smg [wastewater metagenome]|uniref:Protein Smg n=2 Tax=unclassified sequences TaxID=12908 RepID=A0A5B8R7W2_9ZZZZ|nr:MULTISPECIES: DUF494 domain-containing protein [Arhodomonas]MCS4505102.1 DUF494 domain-containing protein [Arhodomonas aquaeolei]QEA04003.1 protein Smg [uncultured organism]